MAAESARGGAERAGRRARRRPPARVLPRQPPGAERDDATRPTGTTRSPRTRRRVERERRRAEREARRREQPAVARREGAGDEAAAGTAPPPARAAPATRRRRHAADRAAAAARGADARRAAAGARHRAARTRSACRRRAADPPDRRRDRLPRRRSALLVFGVVEGDRQARRRRRRRRRRREAGEDDRGSLIPEGLTAEQIADVAKEAGLKGDYWRRARRRQGLRARRSTAPRARPTSRASCSRPLRPAEEGDRQGPGRRASSTPSSSNFTGVDLSYAKSKNLTAYDVLKIASMIEKEIAGPRGARARRRGDLQPARRPTTRSGSTRRSATTCRTTTSS